MSKKLKDFNLGFFGTPEFAVHTLEALKEAGLSPDIIVTTPDKPAGRGMELQSSPVKKWGEENEIPVLQPDSLKDENETVSLLKNSEWDLFIVSAYGALIPKSVLDIPHKGTLNIHPSLLPKFRGASPIENQILNDEKEVGVSIMLLDEELDHGPIVAQASVTPDDVPAHTEWPLSSKTLTALLADIGGQLLVEVIPEWLQGDITPQEQDHSNATFTKKIEKADGEISLDGNARTNYLKYSAYDGWPGTYFFAEQNGKKVRVKIVTAEYKDELFTPLRVVPEGKNEMDYKDFTRV